MTRSISHITVAASYGGGVCPEQHWGYLITGEYFYLRYRHGIASIQLNEAVDDIDLWPDPAYCRAMEVTEEDDGSFTSERQRLEVFETLIGQLRPGWMLRSARRAGYEPILDSVYMSDDPVDVEASL